MISVLSKGAASGVLLVFRGSRMANMEFYDGPGHMRLFFRVHRRVFHVVIAYAVQAIHLDTDPR